MTLPIVLTVIAAFNYGISILYLRAARRHLHEIRELYALQLLAQEAREVTGD
jgi:hypothetical protein